MAALCFIGGCSTRRWDSRNLEANGVDVERPYINHLLKKSARPEQNQAQADVKPVQSKHSYDLSAKKELGLTIFIWSIEFSNFTTQKSKLRIPLCLVLL